MKRDLTSQLTHALKTERWHEVTRISHKALAKNRKHYLANRYLGFALGKVQKFDEARLAFARAVQNFPEDADIKLNFAKLLLDLGCVGDARPLLEAIVESRQDRFTPYHLLSSCLYQLQDPTSGLRCAVRMLEIANTDVERSYAYTHRGLHRRELGEVPEAIADTNRGIELFPSDSAAYMNRQLFMLADPGSGAKDILAGARHFADVFEAPLRENWPNFSGRDREPWRRLRIGFLSPDFRHHAVMYFIEGMISMLDRSQFDVWAFYLHPSEDAATERIRCHADHFVKIDALTAQEQAQLIQEASIDVLIDLAGHTGRNGLLTLLRKPAPVQVSTIGYPGTTGLKAMDWWISDDVTDPPDAEQFYVEKLFRLPTRWTCYRPMSRNPLWRYQPSYQVQPTPALSNGFVTFGSCNNLGKLTDEVLVLWGRILAVVPNSRLMIEGKDLNKTDAADRYRQRCARLGVDPERLVLVNQEQSQQYLTYHRIDIALDPFPLVGGTTTNDLLWMGVPLVTMVGDSLHSRMGVGSLAYLGRHEWIARSKDEYVEIATNLAADPKALNAIRLGLRDEVEASVLMREDVFTEELGHALRSMWMYWVVESANPEWTKAQIDSQISEWWQSRPTQIGHSAEFQIGVSPGEKVPLSEAYKLLQDTLAKANAGQQAASNIPTNILANHEWELTTTLASRILSAKPHDPVALTVLAEVENAHGQLEFGRVYLAEAVRSMTRTEPAAQLLARTRGYVQAARSYLAQQP